MADEFSLTPRLSGGCGESRGYSGGVADVRESGQVVGEGMYRAELVRSIRLGRVAEWPPFNSF